MNRFTREAIVHGDLNTWGPYELDQNRRSDSIQSSYLYQSLGLLYISRGRLGLYDGSNRGTCIIDTNTAISLAAISNYNWAKIEIATDGFNVQVSVSDIAGETDPDVIPAVFENSYDGDRGGYYISADKRIAGLIYKTNSNANNPMLYIVNCLTAGEGYIGGLSDNELSLKFYKMSGTDGSYYNYLKIMRSLMTAQFETKTVAEDNNWSSVIWSPELELFTAVARNGTNRVMTSPDGVNWTSQSASVNNEWFSLTWSPELGLFCAVSFDGTNDRVMTSPDGINWTTQVSAEDNLWKKITWSPELGLFVAVSQDGANRVMTSPNGIVWTSRLVTAVSWGGVTWSPELGLFCAVGSTNYPNQVMTSPDGTNWTDRNSSENSTWADVVWSKKLGLFVAVALTGTNQVMTSPDGTNWTSQSEAASNQWFRMTWSEDLELLCAIAHTGSGNRIMTSPDGVNWITRENEVDQTLYDISFSSKLNMFCTVSISSGSSNTVMTSLVIN